MIQNLILLSVALFGVATTSYGVVSNNPSPNYPVYGPLNPPPFYGWGGYPHHDRHHRRHQKPCKQIKPFSSINATLNETFPKIDYYYHDGIERAIIVCDAPQQIQAIAAYSSNANSNSASYKNYSIISVSSNSGIVLTCDQKTRSYKTFNYISQNSVTVETVKCISGTDAEIESAVSSVAGTFAQ